MTKPISQVFVYGTLKPGLRYHYVAQNAGLIHIEEATLEGFDLYHLEPENYPALTTGTGNVHGWRFEFEDIEKGLEALDELEGLHLSPPEYRRIRALSQPDGLWVWVYVLNNLARLKSSAWRVRDGIWQPSNTTGELPKGIT
jgi:gamma-glutamylcyclotransferase (GGCT)/AIG2-like uncharacterized protein YtfP